MHKAEYADEKLLQSSRQLEDAKVAREEMYEKYVASRCVYTLLSPLICIYLFISMYSKPSTHSDLSLNVVL